MSFLLVAAASLGASALTLYSGFGLGTLLLPVFALFFPVEVAVAATAVVHGANNVLKIAVVGRHANRELVVRFGVPAVAVTTGQWPLIATGIVAAFAGVLVGKRFLHKITMAAVQALVGGLMVAIALALGAGIL